MKMTQTAFVDSLVDHFDIQYETQTPASVELTLDRRELTRRRAIGLTSRWLVVCCRARR